MDTVNTVDSLGFFYYSLSIFLTFVNLFSHLLVGREADVKKTQGRKNRKFIVNVYMN